MKRVAEREIMEQIKAITNDTSELTSNADDRSAGGGMGSGIGNSQANINLDNPQNEENYKKEEPGTTTPTNEKPNETKTDETKATQGDYALQLKEATENIDVTNNILDQLKTAGIKSFNLATQLEQIRNTLTKEEYEKARDMIYSVTEPNQAKQWYQGNMNYTLPQAIEYFNTLNSKYTTISHDIRSNSDYDNRTDEQIREDTAVQRKAEDTAKAGLNPKLMSIGAGGGGAGGSSAKEEEERKKKKKKDDEDRKQKEINRLLGTIAAIGGAGIGIGNLQLGNTANKLKEQTLQTTQQLGETSNKLKQDDLNRRMTQMYMNRDLDEERTAIKRQEAKARYGKRFNEDETYI